MAAAVLLASALSMGGTAALAETPTPTPTPSATSSTTPTPTPSATTAPRPADGSPVAPAKPQEDADGLELDKERVAAGDWVVARSEGNTPGEKVQFVLYRGPIVVASFVADETGTAVAEFRIPAEIRPGDHVVEATGWDSKHVTNAAFVVVAPAGTGGAGMGWMWIVLGVLAISLIALAISYREPIGRWFSGRGASEETPS
ncbi:hypothetical protein HDC94_000213 [Leifsonia sp. AK011]|uniref:hypothetical protein n=1 Tax=Leifsonia sp. AK011 TaxID=2723075 RepID=UPI0015CCBB70|nr:hypothetical protein [Leifsonia sp. AK011]NYF09057.1 hypothetical protein [Leifsonia sp. AK011]